MLKSFRDLGIDVSGGGTGGPGTVMVGISEALVATAAGILVAVEAVVLYNYFQSRLARMSVELKLISDEFVELLREKAVNGVVPSTGPSDGQQHRSSACHRDLTGHRGRLSGARQSPRHGRR